MMNTDERIWLNNQLFQFTDESYNTNGTVTVNASLSTVDGKDFSPLRVTISIGNSDYNKKNCWLSFAKVNELIFTIDEIMKPENLNNIYNNNNQVDIERRYSNKMFRMLFKKSKDLNDCVLLGIYSNENDRNVTILTLDFFRAFHNVLKQFRDNYFLIENMVISRYLKSVEIEELKSMNNTIKTMPRMFEEFQDFFENKMKSVLTNMNNTSESESGTYVHNNNEDESYYEEEPTEFKSTIEEYNSFVEENVDNISIPEVENIEQETKTDNNVTETMSNEFISKVLNNDINVLYTKTKNIILENCKILSFNKFIEDEVGINPLENVNEKSLKSCIYLSELNIRKFLKQFYLYGQEYPSTCDLIRTEIPNPSQFNKDLAYSLLMIHGYMKNYSSKMESRTNDQLASKTDFYVNLRLFSDIFTYSVLVNENPDVVKSNVKSMYQHFSNEGFFSKFDKELDDYNLDPISIDDITKFADIVTSKLPKTTESTVFQDSLYNEGSIKLPTENRFSIEQIINQIVNLELLTNFNLDIDENAHKFDVDLSKIDKDILSIFKENKKINKQKEKQTNLYRFVKYYDDEISDNTKENFYEYIKNIDYSNFDFVNCGFNLSEFGENIIKGLYQWNNTDNKKEKYSDFFHKCNETILNKNDILTRELENNESNDDVDDWGDII